ncbi:Hypothetical protein R9X50_00110000 [Acrodontium crateriforme]|uniref:Uncharacterized protein n=1 Tax=Acrodontium crateriforme TaxID=150365 RepID=A0AAQ3M1F8_9PEZI|nr:Hypothetical protein R9X50_00110000 [Acrodontium crateriforme]
MTSLPAKESGPQRRPAKRRQTRTPISRPPNPISIPTISRLAAPATPAAMSDAYERERQNNSALFELQSKVSALRDVTIDIYDNARDHRVIDSTSETFSAAGTSLAGSARRLVVMASQGNKVAVFKLAGIIIGGVILLYWFLKLIF